MALLDQNYLDSLVAIGNQDKGKFSCSATGFLVGLLAKKSKDPKKRTYYIFLVTNRHVFEDKSEVYLRFDAEEMNAKVFKQSLFFPNNEPRWLSHPNKKVDLALLNINPNALKENSINIHFTAEEYFARVKDFKSKGICVGDGLFILGFPLGLSGKLKNNPCAKWGILSRYDKEILNEQKAFLIDSSVFPGNSGGPVVLKPEIISLGQSKSVDTQYLIGVICSYIPYEDILYSAQTKKVVSRTEENSGLSYAVPTEYIKQIFRRWLLGKKKLEKDQRQENNNSAEKIKIEKNEK